MLNIVITGDCASTERVMSLADEQRYEDILGESKALFESFDYRIVNLESPVAPSGTQPITKDGPSLRCNENFIKLLSYAGINCATLSNNHFYDYGDEGVKATLRALDNHHIDYVGGGRNLDEASATLYKEINGKTLAIINCSEHEFNIATSSSGGSNPLDPISQYHAIREARSKADHVIVIVHGGLEYYDKPTLRMQETYRFFIEVGADAVINHHQHRFSGYEVYQGKPIFYGLGNFIFDAPNCHNRPWNRGYAVGISLNDDQVSFQLFPYLQCNGQPGIQYLKNADRDDFLEKIAEINTIISQPQLITEAYHQHLESTYEPNGFLFTPFRSRWAEALFDRGLIPFCYPKSKLPTVLNKIQCESHRERLIHFIKRRLK